MTTQEQYTQRIIILLERIASAVEELAESKRKPKRRHSPNVDGERQGVYDFVKAWNEVVQKHGRKLHQSAMPTASCPRWKRIVECVEYEPKIDRWRMAMEALNTSPFHTGGNERRWKATIDFLVSPAHRLQWLEAGDFASTSKPSDLGGGGPSKSVVWCSKCADGFAAVGPGTRAPDAAKQPLCPECMTA